MSGLITSIPSIDLHEDISAYYLYYCGDISPGDFGEDLPGRDADIPKYKRANIRVVFSALFPGIESFSPEESKVLLELYGKWIPAMKYRTPPSILWEHLLIYYKMAETYGIKIAETVTDVEHCLKGTEFCFILHLEGAEPIDDLHDLVLLRKLGLRSIGITWNYQNKYGSGCAAKKDLGLTHDGEELVKTANKLGIVIDLAHASKRTALEALATSKKPVIISHANIRKFVDKPRNVDDEILEALHRNGGVIGISAIGPLISQKPKPTLNELVEHFVYVYETYGPHLLAIGTDFLCRLGLPVPEGFESVDKLPILYAKLVEKGFSEGDLKKIAYENVLRVLRANL